MNIFNPLSPNPTKWPNTLKKIRRLLPKNCLNVFDQFGRLGIKGLTTFGNRLHHGSMLGNVLDTLLIRRLRAPNPQYFIYHMT